MPDDRPRGIPGGSAAGPFLRMAFAAGFLIAAGAGCGSGGGGQSPSGTTYEFMGFPYDAAHDSFSIFGRGVRNVYQVRTSPDGKKAVYSEVREGRQPALFVASEDNASVRRVASGGFIPFDPAVNNSGEYAYARHDGGITASKVFLNGEELDLPAGLYKNLAFHDRLLAMHYAPPAGDTDWLIVYDTGSGTHSRVGLGIVPDFIAFHSGTEIVLQGPSRSNHKNEVLLYDADSGGFSYLKRSDEEDFCYLSGFGYGSGPSYVCFPPSQVSERLLFLGLRHLKENDPTGALAASNNSLGRLSWHVSYRLQGLLALHASGAEADFPVEAVIRRICGRLMDGAVNDNSHVGWPTRKYSVSGTDELSLLVDDAMILYPLLQAANRNLVDNALKNRIVALAEEVHDRHEADYDPAAGNYHFRKGIPYWADGLWLPFNMQNVHGLVLIELYKATGKEKYKARALELAEAFRGEWVATGDGRSLWHYWPRAYYDGWDADDGLSVNTPSAAPFEDSLYEDTLHAGLNVKFVFGIHANFPESPFSREDVESLSRTLRGFAFGGIYSRFISGDAAYQPASRSFIPLYGWQETGDGSLAGQIARGLPFRDPLFDKDPAMTYFLSLRAAGEAK